MIVVVCANGSFVVHCDEVFVLWEVALGIQWMLPRRVADLLYKWRNWLGKHSRYLEPCFVVFDVDIIEGMEQLHLWRY